MASIHFAKLAECPNCKGSGRVLACDTTECARPADNLCAGCKALTCSVHGKLIGGEFTVCRGCFESGVTMADIA